MTHRRRPGAAPVPIESPPQRPLARPVCVRDGHEHLVSEHTMTKENEGRYVAWCGHRVLAAALVCPPGRPCPNCLAIGRAEAAAEERYRWTHRAKLWARLAARLRGQW
jgi:hypothetical protein